MRLITSVFGFWTFVLLESCISTCASARKTADMESPSQLSESTPGKANQLFGFFHDLSEFENRTILWRLMPQPMAQALSSPLSPFSSFQDSNKTHLYAIREDMCHILVYNFRSSTRVHSGWLSRCSTCQTKSQGM
ncbi:hypothetical protein F5Y07DRAFT_133314 [Xylaria sp. FL0933]|nr:hypothetical protein F5Y07DRAFT_133314 [Xylaria sp. FL0933]